MIAKPNPWLRSTELKAETEGLIIAAQDQLLSLTLQDLWRITPVHSLCRICKSTKKRLIIFYLDVPNLQTQGIYNKAAAGVERGRGFGGREKEGGLRRECKGLFPFALDLFSPSPPPFAPRRLGAIREIKIHVYAKRQTSICTTWPSFPPIFRLPFIASTQK